MQQQAARSTTFTDRPISIGFCAPPAKEQLAGVLNHDDLAASNTLRRAAYRMASHLRYTYSFIAQKAGELNLPCPVSSKAPNAAAWTSNQGRMQQRPPFSRRRSPNRPSPISIDIKSPSAKPTPTENQSPP